ncbi:MAG: hypothetical protein FIB06_02105 [Betaproteobacteria bacterium]|nr:hypothetical protein [Betaproteobacteria bacterium]
MVKRFLSLIVVAVLLAGAGGALFWRLESANAEQRAIALLRAVVDTKASAVERWLGERRGDARVWSEPANLAARVDSLLAEPGNPEHREILLERLRLMLDAYDYEAAMIVAPGGTIILDTAPANVLRDGVGRGHDGLGGADVLPRFAA